MIKYLGSKRTLLPALLEIAGVFPELDGLADLFSGTSRVGHAFKGAGYRVVANDHNAYAHALARCYVEADAETHGKDAERLLAELQALPGKPGYFTETFCRQARFIQPKNGERIDAIRDAIAAKGLDPVLEAVLLVSLMEASDRVDSTCGVQMAYVKQWSSRSHNDLKLRLPALQARPEAGGGRALRLEAIDAAREVREDIVYLDPPYNQHSYLSNYHVWETLVRWDSPETYGKARKRLDCQSRKSPFNSKRKHREAFRDLAQEIQSKLMLVSFSDEGFQSPQELEEVLAELGDVVVFAHDFKRYVGARIGIYSPQGQKVGAVGKLRNKEYIFALVTEELKREIPDAVERLKALVQHGSSAGKKAD